MSENSKSKSVVIEQKTITDVRCYLQIIDQMTSVHSKKDTILYRGHADEEWELTPAIGRKYDVPGKKGAVPPKERILLKKEKHIFLDFKRQYYLYADNRPSTDMDILFLAQHFKLPTRLMDWTYNPLIALWFACQEKDKEKNGCVYIITLPAGKNNLQEGHQLDNDIFGKKKKKQHQKYQFIVPDFTNRRYLNQKGMFIWFKDPSVELEMRDNKYIVEKECKEKILQELATLGITKSFVYPTLESLCEDIKDEYLK